MHCDACGILTPDTANFCVGCGTPLRDGLERPPYPTERSVRQIEQELRYVLPMGTPGLPLLAGYLGLFSVLILPAPLALVCGVLGLRQLRRRPDMFGHGRCWCGIVLGSLFTLLGMYLLISSLL